MPPSVMTGGENRWRQAGLAPGVAGRLPPVRPGPSLLPALASGPAGRAGGRGQGEAPPRAGQGGPRETGKLGNASAEEDRRSRTVFLEGGFGVFFSSFGLCFEGYFCLYLMALINKHLPALIFSHGSNERSIY